MDFFSIIFVFYFIEIDRTRPYKLIYRNGWWRDPPLQIDYMGEYITHSSK